MLYFNSKMDGKRYTILVNGRGGKYVYRGAGNKSEVERDIDVLINERRINPGKIEVVPVIGKPRPSSTTVVNSSGGSLECVCFTVLGLAVIGLIYKLNKRKKIEK